MFFVNLLYPLTLKRWQGIKYHPPKDVYREIALSPNFRLIIQQHQHINKRDTNISYLEYSTFCTWRFAIPIRETAFC